MFWKLLKIKKTRKRTENLGQKITLKGKTQNETLQNGNEREIRKGNTLEAFENYKKRKNLENLRYNRDYTKRKSEVVKIQQNGNKR